MTMKEYYEKHEQEIERAADRINTKFDTDRGQRIMDAFLYITAPPVTTHDNQTYMLRRFFIKDIDELCEAEGIDTVGKYENLMRYYSVHFCQSMCGSPEMEK